MDKIAKYIFLFLSFFDMILKKITKRSVLIFFKELYETKSYTQTFINQKKILFFTPNLISKWRVDTLFDKEPETISWINGFKKNKSVIFWDIGANIGLYSVYAAAKFKNLKVIAFEPSTNNLRILSRNIYLNNLQNKILINQIPLTNKENQFQLLNEPKFIEGYSNNSFGTNLRPNKKKSRSNNSYQLIGSSINYFLKNKILEIPDYIKLDVDGLEHLILDGASKYLVYNKIKSILIEIDDKNKSHYKKIFKIMKKSNFKLILKKREDRFYDKSSSGIYNYIFSKIS